MNHTEFSELHSSCVVAKELYLFQIEKTIAMLAGCTLEPLPLDERLNLLAQDVTENEAHEAYKQTKRLLHNVARLGYGLSN
jgi:hypothetical protein